MSKNHKQKFSSCKRDAAVRKVPIFIQIQVIFSSVVFFIGFIFLALGLFFVAIAFSTINFTDLKFSKNDPVTVGFVTDRENTNSTVNDRAVIRYSFTYTSGGKTYSGEAYTTNDLLDTVNVVYLKNNPEIARIQGTKLGVFPIWILLLVFIFPIIGAFMFYFGLKKGLGWINIIKVGQISFGQYLRQEPTNSSVNNQPVYRFFFKFLYQGTEYEATGETHKVYKLTDEKFEPLVFNPNNPNEAVMVDGFPRAVRKFFASDIERAKISAKNNF